jgi:hypothetical protein
MAAPAASPMSRPHPRQLPVEQSADPAFARRVWRLGLVSLVAPGLIWLAALTRAPAPTPLLAALLAGWWLMPAVLFASIPRPPLRRLLTVPATLITVPTLAVALWWPPDGAPARIGWGLLAAGLLLGGVLGGWFWRRWAPVPAAFDAPFAPARWRLVALHVGLVVAGLVLALLG